MNSNQKAFVFGLLRSWLGVVAGYLAYLAVSRAIFYGPLAAMDVLSLDGLQAAIFNLNNFLFALFFTMMVMQRRGVDLQNTALYAGYWILFGLVIALFTGGLSTAAVILAVLQGLGVAFGAHAAHKINA